MSTIEEEQHQTQTFFNVATDPSLIVSICTHNYILVFSSESQPASQHFITFHIHNSTYKIDPASFGPAVNHCTSNLKRTARLFFRGASVPSPRLRGHVGNVLNSVTTTFITRQGGGHAET